MKDLIMVVGGYLYILAIIILARKSVVLYGWTEKTSRKIIHVMVGGFIFLIPLFDHWYSPVILAAPFILITFFASAYSPVKVKALENLGLSGVSVKGDALGLTFYAAIYTILAGVFFESPVVIAAGIIPMTFGDGSAALIGTRFGSGRFRLLFGRTLQGTAGFFVVTFVFMGAFLALLSLLQVQTVNPWFVLCPVVATVGAVVEAISPRGIDHIAVPVVCVLSLLALGEW